MGTWATAYPKFARFDDGLFANQAHNDWVQWAAEGGIPMFGLMLALAIRSSMYGFRVVWGIGLMAIFLHCLVDYPIQRIAVAVTLFNLAAAAECTAQQKE